MGWYLVCGCVTFRSYIFFVCLSLIFERILMFERSEQGQRMARLQSVRIRCDKFRNGNCAWESIVLVFMSTKRTWTYPRFAHVESTSEKVHSCEARIELPSSLCWTLNIFSTSITSVQLMNFRFYYSFRNHWAFYHYCCIHHINHDFIKFRHLATCTMIVRHNMGTILTSLPLEMMVNKMLTRNSNHFHSEPEFIVQSNIWKKIISKYLNISWPNERVNCGVNGPMNIFSRYFVHNMCKCIWNFRYFVISIKI